MNFAETDIRSINIDIWKGPLEVLRQNFETLRHHDVFGYAAYSDLFLNNESQIKYFFTYVFNFIHRENWVNSLILRHVYIKHYLCDEHLHPVYRAYKLTVKEACAFPSTCIIVSYGSRGLDLSC